MCKLLKAQYELSGNVFIKSSIGSNPNTYFSNLIYISLEKNK